ncbi:MAG TPA: alkaline phosphatase PafA [Cyclobacteriaceae bacterium]|nr:alkaline phosphatase PafA [Cyclobacteriaceae bacterium]
MNRLALALIAFCTTILSYAQAQQERPKLVVGIIVDQMRQEYLYRFESKYGAGGFKRIINNGFQLKNAHYNYLPTETGPGHSSVFTGSTPSIHGIVANDWYDKTLKREVNCVDDYGNATGLDPSMSVVSPHRLLATTITDELELSTQRRAKVVGVSIKARGAVLPVGHTPDGAYWYNERSGEFVTSTYYKAALPVWAEEFNKLRWPDKLLASDWKPLLPIEQYTESGPDDAPYERKLNGKDRPVFPYPLKDAKGKPVYSLLPESPFGNDLIAEFAKAALIGEEMGKDGVTDFLTISFSGTDGVGHSTGPNSKETEDTYLRLDKTLEDFLNTLDKEVGKDKYTLFLTSDHGVMDSPNYLKDLRIPAGSFNTRAVTADVNNFLKNYFPGKTIVREVNGEQVYINHEVFSQDPTSSGVELLVAIELITKYLLTVDGIASVYPESVLRQAAYDEAGIKGKVIRGFYSKRAGDIAIVLEPGWIAGYSTAGAGHGAGYTYDTHVPVLFYGAGIKKGSSSAYHPITDIAPTLSVLLKIKFPSGCTGQPITEIVD